MKSRIHALYSAHIKFVVSVYKMTWRETALFALGAHLCYVAVEHLHYKFCVGGLSPISLLYGVNAWGNDVCLGVRGWNDQLGSSLKGIMVLTCAQALSHIKGYFYVENTSDESSVCGDEEKED